MVNTTDALNAEESSSYVYAWRRREECETFVWFVRSDNSDRPFDDGPLNYDVVQPLPKRASAQIA